MAQASEDGTATVPSQHCHSNLGAKVSVEYTIASSQWQLILNLQMSQH